MTNSPKPKLPIQVVFAMLLLVATVMVVLMVLLVIFKPSIKTERLPNSMPPTQTLLETPAILTDTLAPVLTSTVIATDTLTPTSIPTLTSTYTPITKPLPDLTVTGISDPICVRDHLLTTERVYIKLTIVVWNIGRGSTKYFVLNS